MRFAHRLRLIVLVIASAVLATVSPSCVRQAHADGLFWSSASSPTNIGRAELDGTLPQTNFITSSTDVYGIARRGENLYLAADTNIARVGVDGTGINNSFITGFTMISAIAVTADYIFWADGQYIGRSDLNGGNIVSHLYDAGQSVHALAANETHVYFAGPSVNISRMKVDGSGAVVLPANQAMFGTGMTLDSQFLYYTGASGDYLGRMNLDGTNNNEMYIDQLASGYLISRGVTSDGTYLYWVAEHGFSSTYSIARAKTDGSDVNNTFITGIGNLRSVAVHLQQSSQTITFEPTAQIGIQYGPLSLAATASSGLVVSFTSNNTSVCTVSGSVVTFVKAGVCSITALQAGNNLYLSAASVTRQITIAPLPGVLADKCAANGSCQGVDLGGQDLTNLDLSGVNLEGANLQSARLSDCKLDGAKLSNANFEGVDIDGVSFKNADLRGATFTKGVLSATDFDGADLTGANFLKAGMLANTFRKAILNKVNLSSSTLLYCDFTGASMVDINLSKVTAIGNKIKSLAGVKAPKFASADLTRAKFAGAKIPGANFSNANLTKADLRNADVSKGNFKNAIVKGTKWKGATIKGAKGLPSTVKVKALPAR